MLRLQLIQRLTLLLLVLRLLCWQLLLLPFLLVILLSELRRLLML
jgi:hypothetical protein